MLSDMILNVAGQDQWDSKYKHRPSNCGTSRCIRQSVYEALGLEAKPLPGRALLTFDDGHWHEELTADWIQKTPYKLHSRQMAVNPISMTSPFLNPEEYTCRLCNTIVPKQTLHGHIDGIITDMEGLEHLWEHKAINCYTFDSYESGETIPVNYIEQCVLYHHALERDLGKDLSYAILHIKNKNTARYMEFYLSYDNQSDIVEIEAHRLVYREGIPQMEFVKSSYIEHILKRIQERMVKIDYHVAKKELPLRPYEPDTWQCSYCRYADYCVKEYEAEIGRREEKIELNEELSNEIIQTMTELHPIRLKYEKLEKALKTKVKEKMIEKNGKSAMAGIWTCSLKSTTRKTLQKERMTPEQIEKFTLSTPYEQLSIKPPKKEKVVKPKRPTKQKMGSTAPKES